MQYVFFWVFPRRLRFKSRRFFLRLPRKMEPIEDSETLAFKPQTPGKHPKENILQYTYCFSAQQLLQECASILRYTCISFLIIDEIPLYTVRL
jgi:hypothetical protein